MQSRASRVARGWIAGSFATAVAAAGHGLADGTAPSGVALLTGLVFAGVLGTLAIGRRPSLPRLVVVVAGAQLAFHLVFSWLSPGSAAVAGHHGDATLVTTAAHHGTDAGMWAAHGLALVATIWFLRRAELALWGLLRDALATVRGERLPVLAGRPAPGRTTPGSEPRHPLALLLLGGMGTRGPPRAAPAC